MAVEISGVDKLAQAIQQHDLKIKRMIAGQFLYARGEAVKFAKLNAPWTDRSGNARAGLFSEVKAIDGGNSFELYLAHSVFYGIWLEVRFSGKYSIIMPTLNYIGEQLIQRIANSMDKLEAAG